MEILLLMDKMGKFFVSGGKNMGQINIDRERKWWYYLWKRNLRKEFYVVKLNKIGLNLIR